MTRHKARWLPLALTAATACASSKAPAPTPSPATVSATDTVRRQVVRFDTVVHVDTVRRIDTVARPGAMARMLSLKVAPGALRLAARRGGNEPLDHLPEVQDKQDPVEEQFGYCPAQGKVAPDSHTELDVDLNHHKNRIDEPGDGQYYFVAHSAITELDWPDSVTKRNRDQWSDDARQAIAKYEGLPVQVEGYLAVDRRPRKTVYGSVPEGGETTNCGSTDADSIDFHIWLNPKRDTDRTAAVVVEMTPRIRTPKHEDTWTVAKLQQIAKDNRRVRVSGWLMFDQDHPEQLHASGNHLQTRATLWEIHPIIEFEVETDKTGEFTPLDNWNSD